MNSENPMTSESASKPASWWLRVWRNQTLRTIMFMLLRIVAFALMAFLIGRAMRWMIPYESVTPEKALGTSGSELWIRGLRSMIPTVLAYWLMVRFIERRRVSELAPAKFLTHSAVGWIVGTATLVLAAIAMAAVGAYRIQGFNPDAYLVGPLVVLGLLPGITEEIVARGILFRVVEDAFGSWAALVVSALLFGFAHAANPGATVWSSVAIAIEAGLLLGMAYAWTRSLWFCMGLHAAWNFTQGPLLGIPVSGFELKGLLASTTQGPELLSGGAFGAEASVLTVIICVTLAGYFTRKAIDEGKIRPPCWRRDESRRPRLETMAREPA
jgi:uncharacterized protein